MNYKQAQNDDRNIVEHKGVTIFGISLMAWIFSGLVLLAIAAWASTGLF